MTDSICDLVGIDIPPRARTGKVEKVFSSMDINRDGVVTLEEFVIFCKSSDIILANMEKLQ